MRILALVEGGIITRKAYEDAVEDPTGYVDISDVYWLNEGDAFSEGERTNIIAAHLDDLKTQLADFESRFDALLKAFALVVLDEINTIRTNPALGLNARTAAQLKTAIKAKLP